VSSQSQCTNQTSCASCTVTAACSWCFDSNTCVVNTTTSASCSSSTTCLPPSIPQSSAIDASVVCNSGMATATNVAVQKIEGCFALSPCTAAKAAETASNYLLNISVPTTTDTTTITNYCTCLDSIQNCLDEVGCEYRGNFTAAYCSEKLCSPVCSVPFDEPTCGSVMSPISEVPSDYKTYNDCLMGMLPANLMSLCSQNGMLESTNDYCTCQNYIAACLFDAGCSLSNAEIAQCTSICPSGTRCTSSQTALSTLLALIGIFVKVVAD